jgi:hypothetical protein
MTRSIGTAVLFDMRAPHFGAPAPALYAASLEMAQYADEMGIGRVGLMEHHGSDDGYLPSPFVMGGGFAARTKRCRGIRTRFNYAALPSRNLDRGIVPIGSN